MSELPADYETLDDLSERGRELGAKEVSAIGIGWESGPGSCYQAQATVVTASGNKFGPISAWAEPGDSQAPDPPPADNDPFVRDRARIRATRAALKLAYGKDADATQPPHVCLNQIVISPVHNRLYVGGGELGGPR